MNVKEQIKEFIASHPEPKRSDIQTLHDMIQRVDPRCKLWFLDGKNDEGKVVSNPNIGYGSRPHKYADGTVSEFYQIGLSPNKTGISIYILGIEDKKYLTRNIRQHPRQSDRDRVLHTIQNSKRYKHRRPRSGDTIWV